MESTKKTHEDWALIEAWAKREGFWLSVSFHGGIRPWRHDFDSPFPDRFEAIEVFPPRAFSQEVKARRSEAFLSVSRARWARKLRSRFLISLEQEKEAQGMPIFTFAAAERACDGDGLEKLRTAPKSSAVGRCRLRIIRAVPELLALYEARELAAAVKKRKPASTPAAAPAARSTARL